MKFTCVYYKNLLSFEVKSEAMLLRTPDQVLSLRGAVPDLNASPPTAVIIKQGWGGSQDSQCSALIYQSVHQNVSKIKTQYMRGKNIVRTRQVEARGPGVQSRLLQH